MAEKDIIMVTAEELKRLSILRKAMGKEIVQREAAEMVGLSERQVRRIIRALREKGDEGIVHQLRGRASNRKLPEKVRKKVLAVYEKKYLGFGPTLANEKLDEIEKIHISTETLRQWLLDSDLWQRQRQSRPHRQWRERKECFGQMLQMDGSHHDWLQGRGPELVLMAYIDDATGNVYARFYEYEGTLPAFSSVQQYIKRYGLPLSIYLDRHSTYKSTQKLSIAEELQGCRHSQSQFERAMKELGIQVIHANSPQAKGRVERLFKTLQDRLVKEMRLRGIKTLAQANKFLQAYLPIFNQRFRVLAAKATDVHRPLPASVDLDTILCLKITRTVRKDATVAYDKKLYQILDPIKAKEVIIQERIDGTVAITYRGAPLRYKLITTRPKQQPPGQQRQKRPKKVYVPPPDHPWRRFKINVAMNGSQQR